MCGHPVDPDDVYCPRCGYYLRRYELTLLKFDSTLTAELAKLKTLDKSPRKGVSVGKIVAILVLGILSLVMLYYILNMFTPRTLTEILGGYSIFRQTFLKTSIPSNVKLSVHNISMIAKALSSLLGQAMGGAGALSVPKLGAYLMNILARGSCIKESPSRCLLTLTILFRNVLPLDFSIKDLVLNIFEDNKLIRTVHMRNIPIKASSHYNVIINTYVDRCPPQVRLVLHALVSVYGLVYEINNTLIIDVS